MTPLKALLTFVAALAFALAPVFLSPGFGGFDPQRYPIPQVDPPIQPAGYAFAIWGPIYLWLVLMAGVGLFSRTRDGRWDQTRWPLIVSLGVGATWLSVAKVSPAWATILIWVMLIAALDALFRTPKKDRWLLQAPIALYAGWLSAASFVSLALLGAGYGVGTDMVGWAWMGLIAATVFASFVQLRLRRAPEYGAAVVWAFVAVAVQNASANVPVALAALAAASWIATLVYGAARHRQMTY